jgi:hypothetical protein
MFEPVSAAKVSSQEHVFPRAFLLASLNAAAAPAKFSLALVDLGPPPISDADAKS